MADEERTGGQRAADPAVPRRVFVSFSVSGDPQGRAFVRQLLARLNQQALQAWVYESPSGRIPAGASIELVCRSKIEESDLFCVFISDAALSSPYVDMEVSHAAWVAAQRELLLYPIVSTTIAASDWPVSFRQVCGYRGHAAKELDRLDSVEDIVYDICSRLGVGYAEPAPGVLRMPLGRRLMQELKGRKAHGDTDMGHLPTLQTRCEKAVRHLEAGELPEARRIVAWLLAELDLSYGIDRPYFPQVMLGVILLAEAQRTPAAFAQAERHFSRLIAESGPLLDANAYAGHAHALMGLGRCVEAVASYRQAQALLASPDPALFYSLIRAYVQSGLELPEDILTATWKAMESGMVTTKPGDSSRVASVLALAEAYRGNLVATLHAWRQVAEVSEVHAEVVTDACHWLCTRGQEQADTRFGRTALLMVREARAGLENGADAALCQLEHVEARIFAELGDEAAARRVVQRLVNRYPLNPVLAVDAAIFAVDAGDTGIAQEYCRRAADLRDASACVPPLSPQQFDYAVGQANWLLGKEAEAGECFRRTGYGKERWFATTVPNQLGAALRRTQRSFVHWFLQTGAD